MHDMTKISKPEQALVTPDGFYTQGCKEPSMSEQSSDFFSIHKGHPIKNLVGATFGEWTVLEYAGSRKWLCKCSCGEIKEVLSGNLKRGDSTSCGHYDPEKTLFDNLIRTKNGCWEWTKSRTRKGYGRIGKTSTHRLAYELFCSTIPPGMWVLHKCDNPPCFRPDHLFLGTSDDNIADMIAKGRNCKGDKHRACQVLLHGSANPLAKLTEQQAIEIRELVAQGAGKSELARRFNVSPTLITNIVLKRVWKHTLPK